MALPFDLPVLSRGFAALTRSAREAGARAGDRAAGALAGLLGCEVLLRGRAVPGLPAPRAAAARVALELPALPGAALLEAEPALVAALVDLLAGGPGAAPGAVTLTPVEAAALDLLALAALDGACAEPAVERGLAPRLARGGAAPPSALAVELDLSAGPVAGRARLLLPAGALRALAAEEPGGEPAGPAAQVAIPLSIRSGASALDPAELAALAPGDVALLDPPGAAPDAAVLPGGARLAGRLTPDGLLVEVIVNDRPAQLPVLLEIELARVEVPLGVLARLEPGALLPLVLDRRGEVTLRVGERALGRGELVEVDGAVGVRVLALEAP